MRASVLTEFGGPEVLQIRDVPRPVPGPGEALIRVGALGVGRTTDLAARQGLLAFARISPPHILGGDHAGTIVELPDGADGLSVGDRVAVYPGITCGVCRHCRRGRDDACPDMQIIGIHRQGAGAEYTAVPVANLYPIPEQMSFAEASVLVLTAAIAFNQMEQAGVQEGDWVLIQAGGSALGAITAQVARYLGARVVGTSRDAQKRERLAEVGFDAALDAEADDFRAQVLELTDGKGIDVIVDNIGSRPLWDAGISVIAGGGRIVSSGAFIGDRVELDLRSAYTRGLSYLGVRTANRHSVASTWAAAASGSLHAVIDRSFELAQASEAHAYVATNANVGRVVLTVE